MNQAVKKHEGQDCKILVIETSSRTGSMALAQGPELLVAESFQRNLRHAAELLPAVDRALRRLGWVAGDLDEVYVSAGPGSFTGLRIGITMAKTLAMAHRVRIVAVGSIEVIAANTPAQAKHVGVVLDAKRKQVFAGRFEQEDGQMVTRVESCLTDPREFVADSPKPMLLLGEGIRYHRQALEATGVQMGGEELWLPKAEMVHRIGYAMARQGRFAEPEGLGPIYLRIPEAEEVWQRRQGS